ncbi:MAG: nucleotidyltransferase family protein [Pyrinomonadaceae bacterium]
MSLLLFCLVTNHDVINHDAPPASDSANELRWNILQRKTQEVHVVTAFKLFRAHGIEPVLIKGLAAGQFYPVDKPRMSIDIDLAVSDADYNRAIALATSVAADGLAIDLHRELRHLDTIPWPDLFANTLDHQLEGGTARFLRPEDHLRVLCVHWLTDGGIDKSRLWDIYYLVTNRSVDFDWHRFLNIVEPSRRRWLECTLGLTSRYLGLSLVGTPVERAVADLPKWLVRTVESEWVSGDSDKPLEFAMFDSRLLVKQLLRRLRPNPIRSTVEMEGSFDARTRILYQIGNSVRRVSPTVGRVATTLRNRFK